jgi:hypothetical protein
LRAKALGPSTPRDGHLARHRPVAGLLLDALLFGHDAFSEIGIMPSVQADEMRLHLENRMV